MKALTLLTLLGCAGLCFAGTRPRAGSSEYRNREAVNGITVAAEIVPSSQVRNTFATDLTREYVVIEVAVYPAASGPLDVSPSDFLLHCGTQLIRPANPKAIAGRRREQNAPRRSDIDIYPTVGVGYESGTDQYGRRGRGVYTTTGVAIAAGGSGNPRPASTDQDRRTMELELEEKQLPAAPATQPVAGFLYFPFPAGKHKNVAYELEYAGPTGKARLFLK